MKKILSTLLALCIVFSNFAVLNAEGLKEDELDIKWIEGDYSYANGIDTSNYIWVNKDGKIDEINLSIDGKCGIIDTDGNVIIPCEHDQAYHLINDIFMVFDDSVAYLMNKKGEKIKKLDDFKLLRKFSNKYFLVEKDNKMGFVDENFNEVLPIEYDYISTYPESGLAHIEKGGKSGLINDKLEEVLPCKYDFINLFNLKEYGLITFHIVDKKNPENIKIGLLDDKGNIILPCEYEFISVNTNNIIEVIKDNTYSIVNREGRDITRKYIKLIELNRSSRKFVINFISDYLAVLKYNDRFEIQLLNKNAQLISDEVYDNQILVLEDGVIRIRKDDKYAILDEKGNKLTPFKYDYISPFKNGVAKVCIGCRVEEDGPFPDDLVVRGGIWGLINNKGEEIVKCQYTDMGDLGDDLLLVNIGGKQIGDYAILKGGKCGYINPLTGEEIIPLIFDDCRGFTANGYVPVLKDGKWGILKKPNIKYQKDVEQNSDKNSLDKIDTSDMDKWAVKEVTKAIKNNLVPKNLQNNYREKITRKDFAQLIVSLIEAKYGKDIEKVIFDLNGKKLERIIEEEPFIDTKDKNVMAAKTLYIINGVGGNKFAPNNSISRQDAAVLLQKTAEFLGKDSTNASLSFKDKSKISKYAKQAVADMYSLKVMNGVGKNKFNPKGTYTREQAYITIYRLFTIVQDAKLAFNK